MKKQEIGLVRDICHEVDCLVTKDPGTCDLEVLEKARLKMNDLLWKEQYVEAEKLAYAILLKRSGQEADSFIFEQIEN